MKKLKWEHMFMSLKAQNPNNKSISGFTLLELLIAVAIMSILLAAVYGSFFSVLISQSRIEDELERTKEIRRFLDIFSLEVQSSFFKEGSASTRFTGEKKTTRGKPSSDVAFTAFTYPIMMNDYPVSDLMAVHYFTEETKDMKTTLYKEVWNPYTGKGGFKTEVIEDVEGFEVSYFNGKQWASAWDSSMENKIPDAVKVNLFIIDRGEIKEYSASARTRIK